jgi:uncharacterized membrane protein YphA (DoxX/SURF4 family)
MNIILWTVQGLLALLFLTAGATKLMRSKEQLAPRMQWVEDFSQGTIRAIGSVEVLGALGLVLPALMGVLPWLTPLAGVGLVLVMIGAMTTHARRREYPTIGGNAVLGALAAFVAYGRFMVAPL